MTVWQLHRWLGQYDAQVKDLSSLSRCISDRETTHHQIQENKDIIVMQNVSFVVVFWLVFLHSNCQNYSFLPRLPSSSRTSTTHFLVKDATTEAIPCNGLIV